jgi:2,4-dienoyl-CoA reductase-like NADH-dependent reductase (Old Yellow Enzyme family)
MNVKEAVRDKKGGTMDRSGYKLFSEARIGNMTVPNRLVRSATHEVVGWKHEIDEEFLHLYKNLALGSVGMIITGVMIPVVVEKVDEILKIKQNDIENLEQIAKIIHKQKVGCKIIAQLGLGRNLMASDYNYRTMPGKRHAVSVEEIAEIEDCFVGLIRAVMDAGFDGAQLHAAHGYFLSSFLSPFMNRRTDQYGGSVENRARIIGEMVAKAREKVGDFPILVKMNCTDNVEGGMDLAGFVQMANEIQNAGIDAVEVSGSIHDCLIRSEEELGFRPIPYVSSHTRINQPERQSYYLRYAEKLELKIPVILVGGNRDVERLEQIIKNGVVDFIALSRPLISEPDLPNRWLRGEGSSAANCISCNSCCWAIDKASGRPIGTPIMCVYKHAKSDYKKAQIWLEEWVKNNKVE